MLATVDGSFSPYADVKTAPSKKLPTTGKSPKLVVREIDSPEPTEPLVSPELALSAFFAPSTFG